MSKLTLGKKKNISRIYNRRATNDEKILQSDGIDRINNDLYRLGYTGNIKKCKKFYIEGGWKREDLVFERKEMGGK